MEEKILIDKDTLKAIAVDTRLNILKLLTEKKYTLSDIAEKLGMSNSTVKEHLDILLESKLIKKEDTKRKWKFYSLTFKGKRLVQPREVKVLFAFIFTLIGAVGIAVMFAKNLFSSTMQTAMPTTFAKSSNTLMEKAAAPMMADVAMEEAEMEIAPMMAEEAADMAAGAAPETVRASADMAVQAPQVQPEFVECGTELMHSQSQTITSETTLTLIGLLVLFIASAFLLGWYLKRRNVIVIRGKTK